MSGDLQWSNPNDVDLSKGGGMLYFVRVTDSSGKEYRYIGQTKRGKSRLREYRNNVRKIFEGKPRRSTPGQEKYRPVHLALAKACQNGWNYDFYPLENVSLDQINFTEQSRISELGCGLNVKWSWYVEDYDSLSVSDIP